MILLSFRQERKPNFLVELPSAPDGSLGTRKAIRVGEIAYDNSVTKDQGTIGEGNTHNNWDLYIYKILPHLVEESPFECTHTEGLEIASQLQHCCTQQNNGHQSSRLDKNFYNFSIRMMHPALSHYSQNSC